MTLKAIVWVLDEAPVNDAQSLAVLFALAEQAHEDGTGAYPSHATLARRGRCSVSTVQRRLAELEAAGLIRRGDQTIVSRFPPNRRPVVWDLCINLSTPVDNLTGQVDRPVKSEGLAGQIGASDRSLLTDKPNTNQEMNQRATRASRDLSTQGFPPSPTALRAAELAACDHGAPPGRCALCRRAGHDD
jgi:DNA-binding transcriptional MocR family regulator